MISNYCEYFSAFILFQKVFIKSIELDHGYGTAVIKKNILAFCA